MTEWITAKMQYDELTKIVRILKESLEDIASDHMSEGKMVDTAIETLQSMEDICKSSEIEDIRILPKLLNT